MRGDGVDDQGAEEHSGWEDRERRVIAAVLAGRDMICSIPEPGDSYAWSGSR